MVMFLGRMVILETSIQKHWKHHTIIQISYNLIIIRKKKYPSFMFLRSISILMLQAFSGLQWPSVAFKLLTSPASTSSKVGIRPLRPSEHFHLENSTKNWKIPLMIWSVNHWQTLSLLGFLSHSEMWVVASAFLHFQSSQTRICNRNQ
jgi:hypothetical protein